MLPCSQFIAFENKSPTVVVIESVEISDHVDDGGVILSGISSWEGLKSFPPGRGIFVARWEVTKGGFKDNSAVVLALLSEGFSGNIFGKSLGRGVR